MRISFQSALSNINCVNNINKKTYKTNLQSSKDIFVKSVSFTGLNDGKSFEDFDTWAKKSNFGLFAKDIVQDRKNFSGTDAEGDIYVIPNCDKWILKKHKQTGLYPRQVSKVEYFEVEDTSPQVNIGQRVASVWIPMSERVTNHFYLHKKQDGGALGVRKLLRNTASASSSREHIESLSKVASLPQESFNQLAKDVKLISDKGYRINGAETSNFSVDMTSKRITFVGLIEDNARKTPQHTEALYALIGGDFSEKFNNSHRPQSEKDTAIDYSDIIVKKYMDAVSNIGDEFTVTEHVKPIFGYLSKLS